MSSQHPRLRGAILLALVAAAVLAPGVAAPTASQSPIGTTIYLPLAALDRSPLPGAPNSAFGMVMSAVSSQRGLDGALAAGATWIRSNNNLRWRDVEPVEGGGYNWSAPSVKLVEQEILAANQRNLTTILLVRSSPRWATKPYKSDCAPISPDKYASFAAFLAAAVERYSKPPFNVAFWQIGNEPDAYLASSDQGYGCWGIRSDPYYGGRAYGEMLKVVYPAIKAANPSVQVMHGSLLLDRPYDPETGKGLSARFLEGVFLAGAAQSFDVLPFNAYWWTLDQMPDAADWKAKYLIDLQASYGVPRKPMIATETGLLCSKESAKCQQQQAYAVGRYYARAIGYDLLGALWYIYDSDSFYYTALVDPANVSAPRPAYYAYRQAAAMLAGARYLGGLAGQPSGVEGHWLARPDGTSVVVVWSDPAQPIAVPVKPGAAVECSGWDGAPLPCANDGGAVALTAQPGPTYVLVR